MKTALLLWDHIEHIIPWKGFKDEYGSRDLAEAAEIIAKPHLPSRTEQARAHKQIRDLAARRLPDAFYFQSWEMQGDYEIYPQKLLPDTWALLQQAQIAGQPKANADFPVSRPAGLSVMSILADCCAGTALARITDQGSAYATVTSLLQGAPDEDMIPSKAEAGERFLSITLDIIDASSIDLKRLIEFRKREHKSRGHALRDLRHRYVDRMESYVETLTRTQGVEADYKEISRQLNADMKDDLTALREELGFARNDVLFSREMITAGIAGIGTIAAFTFGAPFLVAGVVTALGAPVTIGGLLGSRNKFLSTRKSVLQKHPMSYLYELQGARKVLAL